MIIQSKIVTLFANARSSLRRLMIHSGMGEWRVVLPVIVIILILGISFQTLNVFSQVLPVDNDGDGVPAGTGPLDDCDDNDANNFPGNLEVQDDQDNDCDGVVDEVVTVFGRLNTIWGSADPGTSLEHTTIQLLLGPDGEFKLMNLEEATKSQGGPFEFLRKNIFVTGFLFSNNELQVRLVEGEITGPSSHILGSHVLGSQEYLTLPCRFGDATDVTPEPLSFFEDYMDFMDDYWREVSYENINLVGSVEEDWVNLPDPHDDYFEDDDTIKFFKAASECMAEFDDDVFFPDFDGINFMYNQNLKGYSWGGSYDIDIDGEVKNYPMTWMAHSHWSTTQNILGQEMGHSFGLPHESGMNDDDNPYDSKWDVMSSGGDNSSPDPDFGKLGVHVVAVYKDALGWINAADVYMADMSDDQEVFIERLAEPTDLGNADVYLEAQIEIGGSPTDFYTIEARKFVGFDASGVPGEAILIHIVDTTLGDRNAQVIDATDNENPNDSGAKWVPGELFVDDVNNISIGIVDMTATGFNVIINPTVADVSVEKTGPSDPVVAGEQITYTVNVENDGPSTAENVVVTDTLHPDLILVGTPGGCVEGPPNTLTCDLGDIVNGGSDSFDITVDIPADLVYNGGNVVGNEAEVSSDQFDDNTDNNDAAIVNDVIAETDVAIVSFVASETPGEIMLGDSFDVTLTKTITLTNLGKSEPVDVDALGQASGDGVSIDPPQVLPPRVFELFIGDEAEIIEEYTVTCEEAGTHEITFTNEIMPVDAEDPDTSNNNAEVTIEVDCVIPVQINIHPASDPNSINIIKRNGVIPVVILSTLEGEYGLPIDVDATMVDPSSVHFGPADVLFDVNPPGGATEFHNKGHIEDSFELDEVTQDGDDDMVLHFKAKQTELDKADTEGCVKGKIDIGGMLFTFFGCDDIRVPPGK